MYTTGTSFFVFSHPRRSTSIIRTVTSLKVPPDVYSSADIIAGLSDFPSVRKHHSRSPLNIMGEPRRERREDLVRVGKSSEALAANSGWDWWLEAYGTDSALTLAVGVYTSSTQPVRVHVQLTTSRRGYELRDFDISTSQATIERYSKYNYYDFFLNGLANGMVEVQVTLESSTGQRSNTITYGSPVSCETLDDEKTGIVSARATASIDSNFFVKWHLPEFKNFITL